MKKDKSVNNNEDKLYEERCKAYQDYFGDNWYEFESHWMAVGLTPEEALEEFEFVHIIDYCDYCKRYYWINSDFGVYHCPYCHHRGSYSAPDTWNQKLERAEEHWEQITNR